jgi:hypothetical protein
MDKPDRRQGQPATAYGAVATNGAAPRKPRRGIEVVFHPASEERPDEADLTEATNRLLGGKSPISG